MRLSLYYTALITAAMLLGGSTITALYTSGSQFAPLWRESIRPGPLSVKHAFLKDTCEACHTPFKGVEAKTCITCHAPSAATLVQQSTAFHANIQDCRGCHVEHEGAARPIQMRHRELVRIGVHLRIGVGGAHPVASRQMIEDISAFLGIPSAETAEKNALNCSGCHSNQDRHQQLFGRECADCHGTGSWQITAFLHPSPTSHDCAQCHQAPPSHYMMHFNMISMRVAGRQHAQVNQCYLCHKTNAWNDIKGAGWYKHH
jgi:hypothetical protein